MLTSFEIKNFRTFSHLYIERLGRVNLILGKNNVGKTTLLEALRLYAAKNPRVLQEDVTDHDELLLSATPEDTYLDYRSLFHGRQIDDAAIVIATANGPDGGAEPDSTLTMKPIRMERVEDSSGEYDFCRIEDSEVRPEGDVFWGLAIYRNNQEEALYWPRGPRRIHTVDPNVVYVVAGEVPSPILAHWWDSFAATSYEREVIDSLSIVAPLELIRLVVDPTRVPGRIFVARLQGEEEPVPLKSLGGGSYRMFQIATAFAYSARVSALQQQAAEAKSPDRPSQEPGQETKVLLIDEIENGIHHTLHTDLWKFVFHLARQHDLQVFATSHSWDCLKGFQQALAEDEQADGLAIRLETIEGHDPTRAVIFDREDLPIVTRERIEVR